MELSNNNLVYEGMFLSSSPTCFMLQARGQQNCIICKSGYLIDYQNNMDCVSPSSNSQSTIIDNVKDWFPIQFKCPKNMILNSQNVCICMFQYYRVGDDCFLCKNYCKGCLDADTCIQMDPLRQRNGKCQDGLFDDGYNCYNTLYNIQSRINYIKTLNPNNFLSGCSQIGTQTSNLIDNSILMLQKEKAFFFSFSVKVYDSVSQAAIAFLQDGTSELFTIMFELTSYNGQSLPSVNLYVKGSKLLSLIIGQQSTVWIGLWTDFNNLCFFIFSDMIMQYQNINVNSYFSSYSVQNPTLCVGKCSSQLQSNYACAEYSQILYIYNLNQINDLAQARYLINLYTQTISLFKLDFFNLPTSNSIKDQSNQYALISNSKIISNRFKGIQFTQNLQAQISGVDIQQNYPSFSCYIFLEELTFQQMIFQIQLGSSQLQYHIVPYGTKAFVRICQFNLCLDTKYSMLNIYEQNFLYIIYRKIGNFQTNIYQEFEVFCNYQREVLLFFVQQIEAGEGFYYQDQNLSEKCFLFKNIQQMECLIPKKGFVFYQDNLLITEDECKNLTIKNNYFHIINPSTQECINTYLSPYCEQLDDIDDSLKCNKCQYIGQDPDKNCECPFGSYLNITNSKCEQCNPQCQTCDGSSNNCLTCKYANQNPPQCECLNSNEFLDENYICKICSYKCQTCYQSANMCQTCSTNRFNPPNCDCAPQYIEFNGQCQPLKCENKCSKCDQSTSNCIECNIGRVNPPLCNCQLNYIENQDGTCSYAQFSVILAQINNIIALLAIMDQFFKKINAFAQMELL
ncbi:bowman-birk serine protease inhibitor family protein (macronuclear) [Tetrahymena thermophila SB210]|uniref:Bowman-birk serine protease inhibitor family protein n=1 Tax=Tetrahymena thermophila (strain SB210) TaxID=312017 RepID=Q24F32_TETTS|nr:bowman-birk serine protease inhibitor family protein [Tetrahymena thermophila SB210]EAS06375.2 bowman-birk serine protease inhibitor family protein [Tetrahymena thermophila SB210]|eukprot:XP_001026620.2 bowman-birk serine protease inhibitor family protein [Tetrahymena thermophila SB210]